MNLLDFFHFLGLKKSSQTNDELPNEKGESFFKSLRQSLGRKHRFVVMDSDTFKEKFSFQLSGINIFVAFGVSAIVLVALTALIIAFTPLREFIPGYTSSKMVEQSYRNVYMVDSLERQVAHQEWMIVTLQDILAGRTMPGADSAQRHLDSLASLGISVNDYRHSLEDSLLRSEIDSLQRIQASPQPKSSMKTKKNK